MPIAGDLDHAVFLVRDLDEAERAAVRLGFRPTPRGEHSPAMGTANATIVFPDRRTYVELLGIVRPTSANSVQRARLERGGGLFGLAFKGRDARADAEELARLGVADGAAIDFSRPVALESGSREARFTVARARPEATPGAWCFVCQHHTPELVWREDFLEHPNGALALIEIVGVASDPGAIEPAWRRLFGERVQKAEGGFRVRSATAPITFLSPEALAERLGELAQRVAGDEPRLVAASLALREATAAEAWWSHQGVRVNRGPHGYLVAPSEGFGAVVEFRLP
ncbi:MAG: VOC family protein [Geminicoccaceae bacterium]|nr:VOC family protein [Geminicoccaceae bacterium]MDW8341306.1 VOC family protein [Geminicoccaceae bacterium]